MFLQQLARLVLLPVRELVDIPNPELRDLDGIDPTFAEPIPSL